MICKTGKDRMEKTIWLFGKRCGLDDIKNCLNDRCTEDVESLAKCLSYEICARTYTFLTAKQFDAVFDIMMRFNIMIEFIYGFIRDTIEQDKTIHINGLLDITDTYEYTYIVNDEEFETKDDVLEYIETISDLEFNLLVKAAVYGLMKSDMDCIDIAEMLTPKKYDGTTLIMKYLEQAEVDDAHDNNLEIDIIHVKRKE